MTLASSWKASGRFLWGRFPDGGSRDPPRAAGPGAAAQAGWPAGRDHAVPLPAGARAQGRLGTAGPDRSQPPAIWDGLPPARLT